MFVNPHHFCSLCPAKQLQRQHTVSKWRPACAHVAADVHRCIGRTVWADIGSTALCFRLAMKVMDYNLMAYITALMAPLMPDFKKAMQAKKAR